MIRRVVAMIVASLGLVFTAACGGQHPQANAPSETTSVDASGAPSQAAPTGAACDLLTLEAVSAFLGQPAHVDDASETQCVWLAQTDGIYELHLQIYDSQSYYAPDQWGTPEPVMDLGQEAFVVRQAAVGTVAGFWDGRHAVFLNYAKLVGPGSTDEKADLLVVLLRLVAQNMR